MKILVVEAEAHVLRLLHVNLQRAGYEVLTACSGADALVVAEKEPPDLVIIDHTLPDIAGDALARILHARQPAPALLLLFPKGVQEDWVKGWIEPANTFITKPFNPLEVVAITRKIIVALARSTPGLD